MLAAAAVAAAASLASPAISQEAGAKAVFQHGGWLEVSPRRDLVAPPPTREPPRRPPGAADAVDRQPGDVRKATEAPPAIAVRYCLTRVDAVGGALGPAPFGSEFRSGDRVQLSIETSTEGRLAIVQHGSDGHMGLLYPPPAQGTSTPIPARRPLLLPSPRHSFRFDATPGTERLWLVFGRDQAALAALPLAGAMEAADLEALRLLVNRERGAKNLVIETLTDPGDPCTYVADLRGRVVVEEIELIHR